MPLGDIPSPALTVVQPVVVPPVAQPDIQLVDKTLSQSSNEGKNLVPDDENIKPSGEDEKNKSSHKIIVNASPEY